MVLCVSMENTKKKIRTLKMRLYQSSSIKISYGKAISIKLFFKFNLLKHSITQSFNCKLC